MPDARDLLARVKAISVSLVEAVGTAVTQLKIGDRLYYVGSIARRGANSELPLVDERIAAKAPTSLTDAQAAALSLTTITAYELLFNRLHVRKCGGAGHTPAGYWRGEGEREGTILISRRGS